MPVKDKGIEVVAVEIKHGEKRIHYTLTHPGLGILIDSIACIPPQRAVACEVAVLTQRGTADTYPRLLLLDRIIHIPCYACYIFPTPLRKRKPLSMFAVERGIGVAVGAVWVTYIVKVYSVNVIVPYNLIDKRDNITGRCWISRLHIPLSFEVGAEVGAAT